MRLLGEGLATICYHCCGQISVIPIALGDFKGVATIGTNELHIAYPRNTARSTKAVKTCSPAENLSAHRQRNTSKRIRDVNAI